MNSSWCDDPLELLSFICFFLPLPSLRWLWLIGVLVYLVQLPLLLHFSPRLCLLWLFPSRVPACFACTSAALLPLVFLIYPFFFVRASFCLCVWHSFFSDKWAVCQTVLFEKGRIQPSLQRNTGDVSPSHPGSILLKGGQAGRLWRCDQVESGVNNSDYDSFMAFSHRLQGWTQNYRLGCREKIFFL